MRVLITSSRMPFALGMARKLAAKGREIYAADDHLLSPGNHRSTWRATSSIPRRAATAGFYRRARADRPGVRDRRDRARLRGGLLHLNPDRAADPATKVFASPFRTLARLHDKGAFERLVRKLGLPIPETVLVTSDAELREATGRRARYFARGVYSRGGVCCLTNTGPLAGALEMDEVHPTPASPWLVQPFLDGETVCTYSTAHQGRVSSHLMCRVPGQRKHSTGIQFQAIDATESLKLVEPIVAELGYTGQISFGFLVTDDGLTFVECNPRATDGLLLLMPREELAAGLLAPRPETFVLGARRPGTALPRRAGRRLHRSTGSATPVHRRPHAGPRRGQRLERPAAHAVLGAGYLPLRRPELPPAHGPLGRYRRDMNWDGEHIDGMSNDDAMLLTDLRPSQAKPNAGCPCVAHAIARAVDHVAAPGAKHAGRTTYGQSPMAYPWHDKSRTRPRRRLRPPIRQSQGPGASRDARRCS